MKKTLPAFVRDWMLIIGIAAGASLYFLYRSFDFLHPAGPFLLSFCKLVQPVLLFAMLFLSFCKIEPSHMRPQKWMLPLLLIQVFSFVALSAILCFSERSSCAAAVFINGLRIPVEAALLCLICPTATACAVVTGKLGGNMAGVVTYTVLINLLVSILVPLVVPILHPQEGLDFGTAFSKILSKVFPLLILPCLSAWLVRYLMPGAHAWFLAHSHWSFYIWSFALTLAILMSTHAIVCSGQGFVVLIETALASLLTCLLQFSVGRIVGSRYGCPVTAGQVIGQKNTVFAIWMGYTFLDPVVSVSGGFYSICHNVFNTFQLYRRNKVLEFGSVNVSGATSERDFPEPVAENVNYLKKK